MQTLNKVQRDFALRLHEIGAVKIDTRLDGGFKLKLHEKNPDAPLSPFYLNIRMQGHKDGPLTRHDIGTLAALMARQAREGGVFESSKFVSDQLYSPV